MCECIAKVNAQMKDHNARVAQAILMPAEGKNSLRVRTLVQTEKLDDKKRKRLPPLMATFCPFCGHRAADSDGD